MGMTGLQRLPPFGEGTSAVVYRGIDKAGAERAKTQYKDGRHIHWSGFTSATPCIEVAKKFAGEGGLVMRVKTLRDGSRSRDLQEISAMRMEDEVLLFPNFGMIVTNQAEFDATLNIEVIDLKEQ